MPSKNTLKKYVEGGVYHIYNRGINKELIFLDKGDYSTFLFYLKLYLENPQTLKEQEVDPQKRKWIMRKNFYNKIDLLCYCLMPNHFHLMIRQESEKDISDFMKCVFTNYSMYFNKKYERVGAVFQGRYKAILIKEDNYMLHLSRYIHMNSLKISKGQSLANLCEYDYSSYADYLGKKTTKWLKNNMILESFNNTRNQGITNIKSYQSFIEDYEHDSGEIIGVIKLE